MIHLEVFFSVLLCLYWVSVILSWPEVLLKMLRSMDRTNMALPIASAPSNMVEGCLLLVDWGFWSAQQSSLSSLPLRDHLSSPIKMFFEWWQFRSHLLSHFPQGFLLGNSSLPFKHSECWWVCLTDLWNVDERFITFFTLND